MNPENQKEETTLTDFLRQQVTVKVYQLILILSLGVIVGSLLK